MSQRSAIRNGSSRRYAFLAWVVVCLAAALVAAMTGHPELIILVALLFVGPLLILGRMWRQTHQQNGGFRDWLRG